MTAGSLRSSVRLRHTSLVALKTMSPMTLARRKPGDQSLSVLRRGFAGGRLAVRALARTAAGARSIAVLPVGRRAWLAALHDVLDLLLVDRLVLDQRLGHTVQLLDLTLEDAFRVL